MRTLILFCGIVLASSRGLAVENFTSDFNSTAFVAAEFPRLMTAGLEIESGALTTGFSVGGASFGRQLGNGPGMSVGVHANYTPTEFGGVYAGIAAGWQEVSDETSNNSTVGDTWSYGVRKKPIETAYFASPRVGVRWYDRGSISLASEAGWYQPFSIKRDDHLSYYASGNNGSALSEEDRQTIRNFGNDSIKTVATPYLSAVRMNYRF